MRSARAALRRRLERRLRIVNGPWRCRTTVPQVALPPSHPTARDHPHRVGASRLVHPGRNITLPVQHAPDIDTVVALEVENQVGETRQGPKPQTRQVQFVCVSRGTRGWLSSDVGVGLLKGLDEVEGRFDCTLAQVMVDGLVNVPAGQLSRDDGLCVQRRARWLTRSRREAKYAAFAGAVDLEFAPSSSNPRRCSRS